MKYQTESWGLSSIEMTLAAMFFLVVFIAQTQDKNQATQGQPPTAYAGVGSYFSTDKKNTDSTINTNTMNKVDTIVQMLEERTWGESENFVPTFSSDQKRFFKQIQHRAKLQNQQHDFTQSEWKSILKAASITYSEIESAAKDLNFSDFEAIDWNSPEATDFYDVLSSKYGISFQQATLFAKQNPNTIADWAYFVETQMQ